MLVPAPAAHAGKSSDRRLGLHVTAGELALWRERARTGPYRVTGDVSPNSPGDWSRIVAHKDEFLGDPTAGRWDGPLANNPRGCVQQKEADARPFTPPHYIEVAHQRDAAFYAMITGDRAAAAPVVAELLWQSGQAADRPRDTDFADRSRWCGDGAIGGDNAPVWQVSNWLTKLLYAYDYLLVHQRETGAQVFTSTQQARLDAWFGHGGEWAADALDSKLDELFVDRARGDYELTSTARAPMREVPYLDGPPLYRVHMRFNNRSARTARFVTVAGIHTGAKRLVDSGKAYLRDAVRFGYFPQGFVADFERWTSSDPTKGWKYGSEFAGSLVAIAEHVARTGDTELDRFATTQGALGSEGTHPLERGPKTLQSLVRDLSRYVTGDYVRHGTDQASRRSSGTIINTTNNPESKKLANDLQTMMANYRWRDPFITSIYTRRASDAPPYPAQARRGKGDTEGGESGSYPGVLLMFGGRETGKATPPAPQPEPQPDPKPRPQPGKPNKPGKPRAPSANILLVVGQAAAMNPSEQQLRQRLQAQGYAVTVRDDDQAADSRGHQLVMLSKTVESIKIADRYHDTAAGLMTWEDNAQAIEQGGRTDRPGTGVPMLAWINETNPKGTTWHTRGDQWYIQAGVDPELRAGLSGNTQIYSPENVSTFAPAGTLPPTATVVASVGDSRDGRRVYYVYDQGDRIADGGTAAGRRIYFGLYDDSFKALTPAGHELFDAAVRWGVRT